MHLANALIAGVDPLDDGDDARSRRLLSRSARLASAGREVTVVALVRAHGGPVDRGPRRRARRPGGAGVRRGGADREEERRAPLPVRATGPSLSGSGTRSTTRSTAATRARSSDIDDIAGRVELKRRDRPGRPHPQALIKPPPISPAGDAGFACPSRRVRLLATASARRSRIPPSPICWPGDRRNDARCDARGRCADGDVTASARAARRSRSTEPSSRSRDRRARGKTYTAARMIIDARPRGEGVAITAQSTRRSATSSRRSSGRRRR